MAGRRNADRAPRVVKSMRQRAEEALGVAERRVARLQSTHDQLEADLKSAAAELEDAKRRRDYLAQSPDLPTPPARAQSRARVTTPVEGSSDRPVNA